MLWFITPETKTLVSHQNPWITRHHFGTKIHICSATPMSLTCGLRNLRTNRATDGVWPHMTYLNRLGISASSHCKCHPRHAPLWLLGSSLITQKHESSQGVLCQPLLKHLYWFSVEDSTGNQTFQAKHNSHPFGIFASENACITSKRWIWQST